VTNVVGNTFHSSFVCRFNEYAFHVGLHVIAHCLETLLSITYYSTPIVGLELSLVTVLRIVSLLTRWGWNSFHTLFFYLATDSQISVKFWMHFAEK